MVEDLTLAAKRITPAATDSGRAIAALPKSVLLEVQAGQEIQVYEVKVKLVARLKGLRGFMYRWRVTAFVVFTGGFWVGEMVVLAGAVGVVLGLVLKGEGKGDGLDDYDELDNDDGDGKERVKKVGREIKKIKEEEEEAAESSSSGGLPVAVKTEGEETEEELANNPRYQSSEVSDEADDEGEEEGRTGKKDKGKQPMRGVKPEAKDLGVGTSYGGQGGGEGARRRNIPVQETTE